MEINIMFFQIYNIGLLIHNIIEDIFHYPTIKKHGFTLKGFIKYEFDNYKQRKKFNKMNK